MASTVPMSSLGLARMPLLAELSQRRLDALAAQCTWRRFEPGQVIVSHHAVGGDVHLIVDGRVRIHVYGADGREVLFTQVHEGSIVGDFAAVDGGLRTTDAHASTRVLSASLSSAEFKQLLREEPLVEERYVRYLVGLVRSLTDRVIELSTLAVQNRIRAEVLRQAHAVAAADSDFARLEPAPRHADLAAQVGTTREQVTRELSALTRQGLLQKTERGLMVTNMQRLEELLRGETERPEFSASRERRTPSHGERDSPR
ncbi:Crp/Fnr family transcriptional regulator [Ramlibacter monticola]|uniref:Crp/Fnr family transcriptional regulator n=1 Tax=Ramlibacter monticola TaxID=1926872 RepID=A0A936YYR2_9BURK|nr:Crp/Fnr family transcriptional regulator [Ramlibacter monticola]MBL0390430.1 Crp/Fnr family transcriptional regulator [Ramlibacter monticola]